MSNITEMKGSKVKKKHFKPKHQKAKVFRANEPLLSVFMWGVNHTITGLTHVNVPVMLMPDDFKAFSKIRVDNHHFNKENMPSHFKVKEYCPLVFRNLRERFGINETDYINSLTKSQPVPMDTKGRNNAKLYQSYDKMFVIKVLQSEEVESMHVLLKQYHPYIVEKHGKTFLPQYLGLYRLTVEGAETYLAVMRNIFSATAKVHSKYDLKGTTVDREAGTKEKIKDLPTLKDGDFVREGCKLHVGEEEKEKLLSLLNSDVEFLSRMHLIDYSICLGIHDIQIAEEEASIERERLLKEARANSFENGSIATDEGDSAGSGVGDELVSTPPDSPVTPRIISLPNGNKKSYKDAYAVESCTDAPRREIYYLALVDILSHHGVRKRTATITSVPPEQYAKRLVDFMSKVML